MAKKAPQDIMNDLGKMAHDKAQPKPEEQDELDVKKPAKLKSDAKGLKVPKPARLGK